MKSLFLIRGIPGSGKSTLASVLADGFFSYGESVAWNEADEYFDGPDGYKFDPRALPTAHAICQNNCREAMKAGVNVVIISNTFTQKWEMEIYEAMAAEFGYSVQPIICQGNFGSVHGIPDSKLEKMRNRFEV